VATVRQAGVPAALAQAPLRTVRTRDVTIYAHPRPQMARLEGHGLLHRLSNGFFTVIPQDRVAMRWMPTLEGAAAAVGAAEFGVGQYTLMGLTAARALRVAPRALALAFIAAPRRRQDLELTDRQATIRFLVRDLTKMRVEMVQTDLGPCLATTPEQTVLDVAHLRRTGGLEAEALDAIRALLPRCDDAALETIAREQRLGRALAYVRKMLPG